MQRENTTNLKRDRKRGYSESGVALLLVLWVMTILMVIVFSFSFMVRTEGLSTLSFKGTAERKLLAEAGIERGIMELFYRNLYKGQTVELEGMEVWKTDGTPYTGKLGSGYYTVKITDESGKVDINSASELVLKNLLINAGVQGEEADTIVDSIMDWKDPDDLVRLHGAESDYYMSLPNPYKARNADFDALEELLLVKGMTPEILYGSKDKKGIIDFLTINSKTDKINVNAAPKEVLSALPGVTPEIADAIINIRQTKEVGRDDLQGLVGATFNVMAPYITLTGVNTFTIEALGSKENEKGVYAIRATVSLAAGTDDQAYQFLYYKSPVALTQ